MPKINIYEEIKHSDILGNSSPNVVFIPGGKGEKASATDQLVLVKTLSEFDSQIGKATDIGNKMARELIKMGMEVLYCIWTDTEGTSAAKDGLLDIIEKLNDKGLYNIKFITLGGLEGDNRAARIAKCLEVAKKRGDCIALVDHLQATNTRDAIINELKTSLTTPADTTKGTDAVVNFNKNGAAFTPWCNVEIDNVTVTVPPSYCYLAAFANSVQHNPTWYAAAGSSRGQIPGLKAPLVEFGELDAEEFHKIDKDKQFVINPICLVNPYGHIIWGNRTLAKVSLTETEPVEEVLTSDNFLNVRHIITDIKKQLYAAARKLTFDQNSDVLWMNFNAQMTPLLDRMVSGNGIRGYKVIKEKTNKKATLKARIRIIPIEAVENFELTIELADTLEVVGE